MPVLSPAVQFLPFNYLPISPLKAAMVSPLKTKSLQQGVVMFQQFIACCQDPFAKKDFTIFSVIR